MAARDCENFDWCATADLGKKYTVVNSGSVSVASAAARHGSGGLRLNPSGSGAIQRALDNQATWILGFSYRFSVLPSSGRIHTLCALMDSSTIQIDVRLLPSGQLQVTRNGTVLGTTTATLLANAQYQIELKATVNNSTGIVVLRQSETELLNLSGQDTQATANSFASIIQLGGGNGGAGTPSSNDDFDDWYILDGSGSTLNDFLGDRKVTISRPTGAGNYAQFTPSAGANYQNVDDPTPDGGATKNTSGTPGNIDSFPVDAITAASVDFAMVQAIADKSDTGTRTLATFIRQSATDYAGTAQALTQGAWLPVSQVYATCPDGTSWTATKLNAMEFGYKEVA